MSTRYVTNEQQRYAAVKYLQSLKLPFTLEVTLGKRRSDEQNKLQRKWMMEIALQLGDLPEYWRGYSKLHFGVPILRAENELFRDKYDAHVRPLSYETKIALMQEPLDFPITRIMTSKQKSAYLDQIHRHFAEEGVELTIPDDLRKKIEEGE